jgi:hypothetical protein
MANVLTRLGGESHPPSYIDVRQCFSEKVFPEEEHPSHVNAYEVVRGGALWLVKAGIINDPNRAWHERNVICRSTTMPSGVWYEADVESTAGRPLVGYGFSPEGGRYQVKYNVGGGVSKAPEDISTGQCVLALSLLHCTIFDENLSLQAVQELTQRPPQP